MPWPEGQIGKEPWLRWPGESPWEYYAFCAYRDLPPTKRSLKAAAMYYRTGDPDATPDRKNPVDTRWHTLVHKWRWEERSLAKDNDAERQHLRAMDEAVSAAYREMGERHAREAMALQAKAIERLRMLDPAALSADTVLKYIVQAATLERLARGASLQDLQTAQREREASTTITYVDDWRGDQGRLERLRQEGSRYGNGQGVLPTDVEEARREREAPSEPEPDTGVTITRANGHQPNREERRWWTDRLEKPLGDNPWKPESE